MRTVFFFIASVMVLFMAQAVNQIPVETGMIQGKTLTGQIVIGDPDADGRVSVSYTGNETVTMIVTVNGDEVDIDNGMIQLEEGLSTITVIVTAHGYNTKTKTVEVEWYKPQITETPVIVVTEGDNEYVIKAIGKGVVTLMMYGAEVDNPCVVERGDEDATLVFTATAQEAGKEISEVAQLVVVVPAKDVNNPHNTGVWIVFIKDKFGEEAWYNLRYNNNGDYMNSIDLCKQVFGDVHDVACYIVIDGCVYGAYDDYAWTYIGYDYGMNPLYEYGSLSNLGERYYSCLNIGYSYIFMVKQLYDPVTLERIGYSLVVDDYAPAVYSGKIGDVNGDNKVKIDDVTALIDYLLNKNTVINKYNADVDDNCRINIADVSALIDLLLAQ